MLRGGKWQYTGKKLHMEEICILFPFTSYLELFIEFQTKFSLWVVPSESEEAPNLLL